MVEGMSVVVNVIIIIIIFIRINSVVSNECDEPTSCIVQPIGTHDGEVIYLGCVCFRGSLVS